MAASHLRLGNRIVSRELEEARAGASSRIADGSLRAAAMRALEKRGNIEGAALLATIGPAARRSTVLRAVIAFQLAYNHLDSISELPSEDPVSASRRLHQALIAAVQPEERHLDYYAHTAAADDGGYLLALLERCREAVRELPSFAVVEPQLVAAAGRIRDFQTLSLPGWREDLGDLHDWALGVGPPVVVGEQLHWWESAASCGSSLLVHALLAAAGDPRLDPHEVRAIENVYVPAAALHSLLDSLVDRDEDRLQGQPSLYECYPDDATAAAQLAQLADRAAKAASHTSKPRLHTAILTAMCSYYLSAPQRDPSAQRLARERLLEVCGPRLRAALAMFRLRRTGHGLLHGEYV